MMKLIKGFFTKDWSFQLLTIQSDKNLGKGIAIATLDLTDSILRPRAGGLFVLAKVDEGWSVDLFYYNLWSKNGGKQI